ncbi:MAG: hypothetical protein JOY56_12275, partial [Solirubrobacterales bacterium]|nr:hypothetical protein [Solirubrobacterales bacterium]
MDHGLEVPEFIRPGEKLRRARFSCTPSCFRPMSMRTYVPMELNSNVKGVIAEQAIVLAATKLRVPVWRPVSQHG